MVYQAVTWGSMLGVPNPSATSYLVTSAGGEATRGSEGDPSSDQCSQEKQDIAQMQQQHLGAQILGLPSLAVTLLR